MAKRKKIHPDIEEGIEVIGKQLTGAIRDQFQDFILQADDQNNGKKNTGDFISNDKEFEYLLVERARYGGKLSSYSIMKSLPIYNPDNIPISTYEMMMDDPQLASGIAANNMPILAAPFRVECSDIRIREFVKYNFDRLWHFLIRDMLLAPWYGFVAFEKVYQLEYLKLYDINEDGSTRIYYNDYAYTLKKLKPMHPNTVRFILDDKENLVKVRQESGLENIELEKDKYFLYTHNEQFGNFYGKSRLRTGYKIWYWCELLYQFMLRYFERRGSPAVIVRYKMGESVDPTSSASAIVNNYTIALKLGASILNDACIALPSLRDRNSNYLWDVSYLSDQAPKADLFMNVIDHLDVLKLRSIWVPERALTQDTSSGSFSMAEVHVGIFFLVIEGLMSEIEHYISTQLIDPLIKANFIERKYKQAIVVMDRLSWERKAVLKTIYSELIQGMMNALNNGYIPSVLPSIKEISRVLDIPLDVVTELYPSITRNDVTDDNNLLEENNMAKQKKGKKPQKPTK